MLSTRGIGTYITTTEVRRVLSEGRIMSTWIEELSREAGIPPAFIVVDGSGEITIDAIDWLATQSVPLIRLRWDGCFASVVSAGGQAAASDKVYCRSARVTIQLRGCVSPRSHS